MHREINDESGAEIIEFAISFPIFLVMAIAIVQLCLVGFQTLSLEQQVTNAAWNMSASDMLASRNPSQTFKDAVCENTTLRSDNITVKNMQVQPLDRSDTTRLRGSATDTKLGITWFAHERGLCTISCDVSYKMEDVVAIPGLRDMTITRHIERTLVDTDRIEVR